MGKITKIEVQKNDKNRVNVYIDGDFWAGLDEFIALKHRLKPGVELSDGEMCEIALDSDGNKAFEKAMSLLSKRPKTEKQIRDYLKEKGYIDPVIENVVEKLYNYKYLNDLEFAKSFISFHSKKWGAKKIKFELKHTGVADEVAEEAFEEAGSQKEEAYDLAKKFIERKDEFIKEKVFAHLYSKGFLSSDISYAIDRLKEDENGED